MFSLIILRVVSVFVSNLRSSLISERPLFFFSNIPPKIFTFLFIRICHNTKKFFCNATLINALLSQNLHLSNFTLNKSKPFKKQHKEKLVNLWKNRNFFSLLIKFCICILYFYHFKVQKLLCKVACSVQIAPAYSLFIFNLNFKSFRCDIQATKGSCVHLHNNTMLYRNCKSCCF